MIVDFVFLAAAQKLLWKALSTGAQVRPAMDAHFAEAWRQVGLEGFGEIPSAVAICGPLKPAPIGAATRASASVKGRSCHFGHCQRLRLWIDYQHSRAGRFHQFPQGNSRGRQRHGQDQWRHAAREPGVSSFRPSGSASWPRQRASAASQRAKLQSSARTSTSGSTTASRAVAAA